MMDIVKFFEDSINNNKLSHLYLIVGPKGDKRESLVLNVIEKLIHHQYSSKLSAEESSQIYWIEAENTTIKKQQIVQLQEEFMKTSLSKGRRIYVIEDIETMNIQSANALLKFLEEPLSTETVGLLLTNKPQAILDTILSRAQVLKMPYLSKKEVMNFLDELNMSNAKKSIIASLTRDVSIAETLSEYQEITELTKILEVLPEYLNTPSDFESWLLDTTKIFSQDKLFFEYLIQVFYRLFIDIKKEQPLTYTFLEAHRVTLNERFDLKCIEDVLMMFQQTLYELRYNIHLDTTRRKMIHAMKGLIKS